MTDEEKQTIELIECFEPEDLIECAMYRNAIEKIKNLIEKQQKEIEELKDIIKVNKWIEEDNGIYNWNVVPKQKIKDKIEELKKCLPDPLCEENIQWRIRELEELLKEE